MKRVIAEFGRRWSLLLYTAGLPAFADRRVARRTLRTLGERATGNAHLLVAAPGNGNVGDQALFEAFVENTPGPVVAIVRSAGDLALPPWLSGRVRFVEMPDLIYGHGAAHAAAVAAFTRLAAESASLSIIGADVMDGRYSVRGSVRRAVIAEIGALAGTGTRITGFSWNARPRFAARRALVRASRAGVLPLLRDPRSAERATGDGVRGVLLVADLVFAASGRQVAPLTPPRPYAIVNVSGLIARTGDFAADYVRVVEHLRLRGLHVVLLPHVVKPLSDDLAACRDIAQRVGERGVTLVTELLGPAQVRDLAAGAEITVTGRMHLAIMSLLGRTPAVTLATQGKVEGLMDLFDAPQLCVRPAVGFGDAVVAVVDLAVPASSDIRANIDRALPSVIALAKRNTEGTGLLVPGAVGAAGRVA